MTTFRMYNRTTQEVIERHFLGLDLSFAEVLVSAYEYGCEDDLEFFFTDKNGTRYHYEWVESSEDCLEEWGDYEWVRMA